MSTQNQQPSVPQSKSCLERAITFSIRLLFVFMVGIAIGVGIYFGIRLLYGEYQSITQDYDSRLTALETSQSESGQQVTDRLSSFQTRLETLEIQGDTQNDAFAELESRLNSQDDFRSYHATVVAGQQETLLGMQDTILALQNEVNVAQSELETVQGTLMGFQDEIIALQTNSRELVDIVEENQAAINAMNEMVLDTETRMTNLEYHMAFLRGMELLTRARLNLVQGNTTLAQSDIEATRALLADLEEVLPPFQAIYVAEITAMIDDALTYLPETPLATADRLENVWQMLMSGLPDEADLVAAPEVTPEPLEVGTPTPTPQT